MELTPEQEAAVKDIAERYLARRARGVKTGASVQRNQWTKREAMANGARNDLRSALHRLSKARNDEERALAQAGVESHRRRLAELEGD